VPFFRRKSARTVIGPDGTEYVPVPTDEFDEMLGPLVERAVGMYEPGVLPKYADLAAKLALTEIILPQESGSIEPTAGDLNMSLSATTLGYVSRLAEFEFIEQSQSNEHLRAFLAYAYGERAFGEDWFANIVGTAGSLMNGAAQDPFGADTAPLLGAVGIGYDARQRFGFAVIASLLTEPDSGHTRTLDAIMPRHLYECWRFGYWLAACDASLPDDARASLSS